MAKAKKGGKKRAATSSKAPAKRAPARPPSPAKKATAKAARKSTAKAAPTRAPKAPARAAKKAGKKAPRRRAVKAAPVIRVVKVKQLDPIAKCGPGTSVEQLFRVDEERDGLATVHLVFFDRHGWYCMHGPRCAAVADVHSHTRAHHRERARAVGR